MNRPVRVLHLITNLGTGGAEVMLCNLLERMAAGGFQSIVITTSEGNDARNVERAAKVCTSLYHLGANAILKPAVLRRIRAIIRREKPDVIQTWMHKADLAGCLAALGTGVPVVWGIHSMSIFDGNGSSSWKVRALEAALNTAARVSASCIVSCSQRAAEDHVRRGYPQKKMRFVPNGIDIARFRPSLAARHATRDALRIPHDAPVVGYMGRFAEVKDLPTFLRAALRLQVAMPQTHFVLCGARGPISEEIAAHISRLPHPEQVHVLSVRPDTEAVYPAFDVMSLTSLSEAYPMVFIEAMACGVPCAGTDTGDSGLLIGDPANVVSCGDDAALARIWQRLLSRTDEEKAAASVALRERADRNFSLDACAAAYAGIYRKLARISPDPESAIPAESPVPAP